MKQRSGNEAVADRPAPVSAAAVARAAGVSAAAVSYVLNGKGGVSTETRRHIIGVANELGFRPRKSTQTADPQRTRGYRPHPPQHHQPDVSAVGPEHHHGSGGLGL